MTWMWAIVWRRSRAGVLAVAAPKASRGAAPEGGDVEGEAEPVGAAHPLAQQHRLEEQEPAVGRRGPVGIEVGLEHGAREVLEHAVEQALQAVRPQGPDAALGPPGGGGG